MRHRHQLPQEARHNRRVSECMPSCQDQNHLESEAEDREDARIPRADDHFERALGRDQQGQNGSDRGQADRQHKGVGHEAFKDINEKWRD
jgi:hypothetical protein